MTLAEEVRECIEFMKNHELMPKYIHLPNRRGRVDVYDLLDTAIIALASMYEREWDNE